MPVALVHVCHVHQKLMSLAGRWVTQNANEFTQNSLHVLVFPLLIHLTVSHLCKLIYFMPRIELPVWEMPLNMTSMCLTRPERIVWGKWRVHVDDKISTHILPCASFSSKWIKLYFINKDFFEVWVELMEDDLFKCWLMIDSQFVRIQTIVRLLIHNKMVYSHIRVWFCDLLPKQLLSHNTLPD